MKEDNSIEKFKLLGNFVKELADMSQQFVDLKSSELQNRMALKRYRDVFHNLPQRIFVKDRDSHYLLCNDLYARDLQIQAEEIVGKQDSHLFPEEYARKTGALEKQIIESGKAGEIEETLWLGGQEIIVQIVRVPLKDEEGQAAGILGVLWEITEKKRAEEEAKKYRTHLEELVFARTSELERVSTQLQGETTSRRRIEEESRSAAEEWNQLRASLQGQVAERLAEIQRVGEQFQLESSSRRRAEEELQRTREEWQRVRTGLEGQLSARGNELQGFQEKLRREEDENKRLAAEYQGAMEEFKKIRSDLENQLAGQAAQLQKIGEQWQQETAERKRVEEEYHGASEEFRKRRFEFEDQLAGRLAELQRLQEQLRQETNSRLQVEADAGKAAEEFQRNKADLEGQLAGRSGELQQVKGQLEREIAERKKAAEALQQTVGQFWTLMDSVEKTLSDLGKDTL
jgi:PAS domain S-box-containing protein